MNHPGRNAIGGDLLHWLNEKLDLAGSQPILLTGTEDSFCSGLNLKEMLTYSDEDLPAFLLAIDDLAVRLFEYPGPTVACVNGHAIAGGCVLALCCDYRIAKQQPDLRIGLPEIKLGACFPPRMMSILRHRLNPQHLYEILIGGNLYDPSQALSLGMIDEIADDVGSASKAHLQQLASYPQPSFKLSKAALQFGVTTVSADQQQAYLQNEMQVWKSVEMKQRVVQLFAKK